MVSLTGKLVVAGVSFKKTALHIRNKFALTVEQIKNIYEQSIAAGYTDFFILSTCNRTEFYSCSLNEEELIALFAANTCASGVEIEQNVFTKTGNEAIDHLLRVASGLESQITGDYEITGQLKKAFSLAKTYDMVSGLMEKLINCALQASRQVKSQTKLSDGSTSVSYAVMQIIRQGALNLREPRICIMGLGKIGALTLNNLLKHLPHAHITLINRNPEKVLSAAREFLVSTALFSMRNEAFKTSDILIVATSAEQPLVFKEDIEQGNTKLIFDLSVPCNVSADVHTLPGVKVYTVDELSAIVNQNLNARRFEIPMAEKIIAEHLEQFRQWEIRRNFYTAKSGYAVLTHSLKAA
jgi:glutamyl-tRNA reductase